MVFCCICGRCGCGRSGAYLDPELQPSPNNPGGCDVHCYAPCCMSCDCLGFRHCTFFLCCTPSKDQMLRMDNPWYHEARVAILQGDPSAVPPGLANFSKDLLTQSYHEAGPYGKELWGSRKDWADICLGGDRFPGGPSLCCGDFWFHPPPFLCCLPLLRFPTGAYEYVADEGDQSLAELAACSEHAGTPPCCNPAAEVGCAGELYRVLGVPDLSELNVIAADQTGKEQKVKVWSCEQVVASLRRECNLGPSRSSDVQVTFADDIAAKGATWIQLGVVDDAQVSYTVVKLQRLQIVEARYGWWTGDVWQAPVHEDPVANGFKDVTDKVCAMVSYNAMLERDELHMNPASAAQWMNQHLWPETASGPAIARRFTLRYRYVAGHGADHDVPVQELLTAAVANETYSVHVTSELSESSSPDNASQPNAAPKDAALNGKLNDTARNTNDVEEIRRLVAEGASLTSINDPQWRHTPLHQAAYHGRPKVIEVLIELCREKNQLSRILEMNSNSCGRGTRGTPLELARGGGHQECVALLVEAGIAHEPQLVTASGGGIGATHCKTESRLTYADSEAYATKLGGRLLTLEEAKALMRTNPLYPGEDQWCAVQGRDWVQVGSGNHHPGKSHNHECGGYPRWGDDANCNIHPHTITILLYCTGNSSTTINH